MKRSDLLQTLKLAQPALLSDNDAVLPILKSFKFTGTHVEASNDVIGVRLSVPITDRGIVSGRKLISFLNACSSKVVKIAKTKKGSLLVKCASSKLTLNAQPEDEWPFDIPTAEEAKTLSVREGFFTALAYCSAQSPDTGLGGWQGGIILVWKDILNVYGIGQSRATLSCCRVYDLKKKRKTEKRLVVPSSFCKVAVALSEALGKEATLIFTDETVVLDWGKGANILTTKQIHTDMPDVVGKFFDVTSKVKNYISISDTLGAALKRAATIGDKGTCSIVSEEDGLKIRAKSADGATLNDLVKMEDGVEVPEVDHLVAADLICKRLDDCVSIGFGPQASVLKSKSGDFIYVVSNRSDDA